MQILRSECSDIVAKFIVDNSSYIDTFWYDFEYFYVSFYSFLFTLLSLFSFDFRLILFLYLVEKIAENQKKIDQN